MMEYRKIPQLDISLSVLGLGTWAFGSDSWWGFQHDTDSINVIDQTLSQGINLIDTAPVYGRGHSEEVIGSFLKKRKIRDDVLIATKVGLRWEGRSILHDLSKSRMFQEFEDSRKRLQTDYFDIYQIHWPDPQVSMEQTAEIMYDFFRQGKIRAIGVSNFSVDQMMEFLKSAPIHTLQPPYNMFQRDIEKDIIPFCKENKIGIISYVPLHSGILTGKFFFEGVKIPSDICRKNKKDLKEPFFSINRETAEVLKEIASRYHKSLSQLVLNWTYSTDGITSVLAGTRNTKQAEDNIGSVKWRINKEDIDQIDSILRQRQDRITEAVK